MRSQCLVAKVLLADWRVRAAFEVWQLLLWSSQADWLAAARSSGAQREIHMRPDRRRAGCGAPRWPRASPLPARRSLCLAVDDFLLFYSYSISTVDATDGPSALAIVCGSRTRVCGLVCVRGPIFKDFAVLAPRKPKFFWPRRGGRSHAGSELALQTTKKWRSAELVEPAELQARCSRSKKSVI